MKENARKTLLYNDDAAADDDVDNNHNAQCENTNVKV